MTFVRTRSSIIRLAWVATVSLAVGAIDPVRAATPPTLVNYQGVLRNASNAPLDGAYDMEFRFLSADVGGDEILIDRHTAAFGFAVTVSGGLFNVQLGGGSIVDGAGPGTYTDLGAVFRDYASVWLAARVGGEDLTPRVRVISAAYALNASNLGGRPASEFLDTSTTSQTKNGPLSAIATEPGGTGVTGGGHGPGGTFFTTSGTGYAYVGTVDDGIDGYGYNAGGFFQDTNNSGLGWVGYGDHGVAGLGNGAGGYFADRDETGLAYVGSAGWGIQGSGNTGGGFFVDLSNSGYAYVGHGDYGVEGYGGSGGGWFVNLGSGNYASVATANYGIEAYGNNAGGYFEDRDSSGYGYIGYGDYGIQGYGNSSGGYFKDKDNSGYASVGYADLGISGYGNSSGGFFGDLDSSGYAYVGYGDRGIWAKGTFAGGTFSHPDNVTFWADVSTPTKKIQGTGTVSFVQNHPNDPSRVIVYNAPEGDEVATYTRGTARLVEGEAHVSLGPDLRSRDQPRSRSDGTSHSAWRAAPARGRDALDAGARGSRARGLGRDLRLPRLWPADRLRGGVGGRGEDAGGTLPSQEAFEAKLQAAPEARTSTALERFREMTAAVRGTSKEALDLSGSTALKSAIAAAGAQGIGRVDPEAARAAMNRPEAPTHGAEGSPAGTPQGANPGFASDVLPPSSAPTAPATPTPPGAVVAFTRFAVSEAIEAGDLLALDSERPGSLRRAAGAADSGVVAIAAAASETIDGLASVPVVDSMFATLRVDAGYGEIRPGNLLCSSPTPGHAMRAAEIVPGTIIGKALEPLESGQGEIRVLLMPR